MDAIAKQVINGHFGNGEERRRRLTIAGYDYAKVQQRANELLGETSKTTLKSTEAISQEVLQGLWGNGEERRNRLTKECYVYAIVQKYVNKNI